MSTPTTDPPAEPTGAISDASATTTSDPPVSDAEPISSVSGTFEIVNTTVGGGEVALEALTASVEALTGSTWAAVEAQCEVDPPAPLVVAERQEFAFACELADALPSGTDRRVVTTADVFGLDQPVRQVIDVP